MFTAQPPAAAPSCGAPTDVVISVDVEFSIGDAFTNPALSPVSDANLFFQHQGRDHGLGFMLETLAEYGHSATFFTETANTYCFGDAPMGAVVEILVRRSHDVQLHLHPCWRAFRSYRWREEVAQAEPHDECSRLLGPEIEEELLYGMEKFRLWGAPAPRALRTGNLSVGMSVYRAMASVGLGFSSNVGLGLMPPVEPELQLWNGRGLFHGVLELPVLTYERRLPGGRRWRKILTIAGSSTREIEELLWQCRAAGISPVILMTHPFEYFKRGQSGRPPAGHDAQNQIRLRWLCEFVARNAGDFRCTTFAESADAWRAAGPQSSRAMAVSLYGALGGVMQTVVASWF